MQGNKTLPMGGMESSFTHHGPAQPFFMFRPQATLKTRQQMREDSPSGVISMPRSLGKSPLLLRIFYAMWIWR